ncbi:DUF3376 domain-containing protein [Massilia cavernae]|uniref:DUF3376 domain-containing protein n=1 Tax=Massilia cavernae TaxID=2320864 RepID=UPI0015FF3DB6|nr:DUF3376 domain-containing protein [Massilia cavernae]
MKPRAHTRHSAKWTGACLYRSASGGGEKADTRAHAGFRANHHRSPLGSPRYEPIFNELSRIEIFNEKIRHLKAAIDSTTPRVQTLVEGVAGDKLDQPADATQVRQWRLQVAHCLSVDTALLYNNYMRLMIDAGLNFLARLICTICTYPQGSPRAHWVTKILRLWAQRIEIYRREYEIPPGVADDAELPPFARLVDTFDLTFRYRRIQFVMRAINRLYPRLQEPGCRTMTSSTLDALKRRLYQQLNSLRTYQGTGFLRTQTASHACAIFSRTEFKSQAGALPEPDEFVTLHNNEISAVIEQIGMECDFARFTNETDKILGSAEAQAIDSPFRRDLLISYLGFAVWDAVTFPMINMQDPHEALQLTELHEIIVDRISPDDAMTLKPCSAVVKGSGFGGFAGFFSHAARENDYLLGRLHAIDRLLNILASSVERDIPGGIDMRPFKKRAFEIVLREEAKRLPNVAGLIAELQSAVMSL